MIESREKFKPYIQKMTAAQSPEVVINNFKHDYAKLADGQAGLIPETDILPLKLKIKAGLKGSYEFRSGWQRFMFGSVAEKGGQTCATPGLNDPGTARGRKMTL